MARNAQIATVARAEELRLEAQRGLLRRRQLIGSVVGALTALADYESAWAASLVKQAERVEAVAKGQQDD